MHVIGHQVPLLNPTFLLTRQLAKHLPKMLSQLPVQRSATTLRNKYNVVFAFPLAVIQTFILVHPDSSFRVLGGSQLEVSAMGTP